MVVFKLSGSYPDAVFKLSDNSGIEFNLTNEISTNFELQEVILTLNANNHTHTASQISVDASGFSGNLGAGDTDVQTALETFDNYTVSEVNGGTF